MTKKQLKKFIGKPCKIHWADAIGYTNESLDHVRSGGFGLKVTIGELFSIEKIKAGDLKIMGVIIKTEEHVGDSDGDFTLVPLSWVTKVEKI